MSKSCPRKVLIAEASEITGVPVNQIRAAAQRNELPYYRVSRSKHSPMLFDIEDLEDWLDDMYVPAADQ